MRLGVRRDATGYYTRCEVLLAYKHRSTPRERHHMGLVVSLSVRRPVASVVDVPVNSYKCKQALRKRSPFLRSVRTSCLQVDPPYGL